MGHKDEAIRQVNRPPKPLAPTERVQIIQDLLPEPRKEEGDQDAVEVIPVAPQQQQPQPSTRSRKRKPKPVRSFLKKKLFVLVHVMIQVCFTIYIRSRQVYHAIVNRVLAVLFYHHRAPEYIKRDVSALKKLPEHLSVVLQFDHSAPVSVALDTLLDDMAEIAAWCTAAGIPMLSVYEKSGALKGYIPRTHRTVTAKLEAYFGGRRPSLNVHAPHIPTYIEEPKNESGPNTNSEIESLSILLLSYEDGRESLVDLTKTLTEMAQREKISTSDITQDLIDAELTETIMTEPDLLILFTPTVKLHGFPPWQLRLTEIFHVPDNQSVGYQVFLRALHRYGKAEMRLGR